MSNWEYRHTSVQQKAASNDADEHMNDMASAGWELVSAAPLFVFDVVTKQALDHYGGPLPWGIVTSSGTVRHCVYWRRASI